MTDRVVAVKVINECDFKLLRCHLRRNRIIYRQLGDAVLIEVRVSGCQEVPPRTEEVFGIREDDNDDAAGPCHSAHLTEQGGSSCLLEVFDNAAVEDKVERVVYKGEPEDIGRKYVEVYRCCSVREETAACLLQMRERSCIGIRSDATKPQRTEEQAIAAAAASRL